MRYALEDIKPYNGNGEKREQVEKMFNRIASTYDALNHTLSLGIDRRWRKKAVNALKPFRPQNILDIATGTGDFAILTGKRLRPQSITGIDISEGMMQVAKEKTEKEGMDSLIRFAKGDCTALPFPDRYFDAATVSFGVRNFEKLDKALQEICRVLKTNGHLVILELSAPVRFPMKQLFGIYSKIALPLIGRAISKDDSAYTYLPRTIKAFPQGETMQGIIAQAGFREVSFKRLTMGICTLYTATK